MERKDCKELNRILSLMENINGFKSSKMLTEARKVESPNVLFDILDKIGNNKFVTIGYVNSAKLVLPKVQRINPLTNRKKGYDDYESFGKEMGYEGEIGGIIKLTSYNFRFNKTDRVNALYDKYKNDVNTIRGEFGIDPMGKKKAYTKDMDYSHHVKTYNGENDEKKGNSYTPQNTYGANINSRYYIIDKSGHITAELTKEQVANYLPPKSPISGVRQLVDSGADKAVVDDFIQRIQGLKFNYTNFEHKSILYIVATVDGEKIIFLNDNLGSTVNDINVNPTDFLKIAKERYKEDIETVEQVSSEQENEQSV